MNRRNFLGLSVKAIAVAPIAGIAAITLSGSTNLPLQEGIIDGIALLRNDKIIAKTRFRSSRQLRPGDELRTRWPICGEPQPKCITVPSDFGFTRGGGRGTNA